MPPFLEFLLDISLYLGPADFHLVLLPVSYLVVVPKGIEPFSSCLQHDANPSQLQNHDRVRRQKGSDPSRIGVLIVLAERFELPTKTM